jgi:hypothetical protein
MGLLLNSLNDPNRPVPTAALNLACGANDLLQKYSIEEDYAGVNNVSLRKWKVSYVRFGRIFLLTEFPLSPSPNVNERQWDASRATHASSTLRQK